ncbi:HD-GYP domain-containing protein [Gulbenkiania mobilis]|uniref:Nucleotidyltransferase with HDIG domain n=1 Tax=Gulbenkiania mobilis TaxID=397457 RepID=A0ABY2CZ13_GULMO|nr:putative nucleotidyltransferase with HDIG domain [Gulbenkiania mobilis]
MNGPDLSTRPALSRACLEARAFQPIIDALTAHVALLDGDATIVGVNAAWMRYADANQGHQADYGIGLNYLALLEGIQGCVPGDAKSEEDTLIARQVAQGLREVLSGRREKFQLEYPCPSPTESRWFLVTITPFPHPGQLRVVVAHEDLTALKQAQETTLRQTAQLAGAFSSTVDAIALFVEKRDPYTAGHQHQVAVLCERIARRMGLDAARRHGLVLGAKIHDIGKIAIPADILGKPGRLSPPELEIIRSHPETGYDILRGIDFPWPIADMVYQHHERLDGSGYPQGLQGDAICLEARIIAVADVYDAITSHRPYRPARPMETGLCELMDGRGRLYDREVVDAFIAVMQTPEKAQQL